MGEIPIKRKGREMSTESKMKNPAFLGRHDGFKVKKSSCFYLIRERFYAPNYPTYEGKKFFQVEVRVDLECSPRERYLKISSRELGGAESRTSNPSELGMGYPFNDYHSWQNSESETFLHWVKRLSNSRLTRPSDMERNGGKNPFKETRNKQLEDLRGEIKYRR